MAVATKPRSRRPKLRIVGSEPTARPPRSTMLIGGVAHIVELWSSELVASTPEWARPADGTYFPRFGYMTVRLPYDDRELEDLYAEIDRDYKERMSGEAREG